MLRRVTARFWYGLLLVVAAYAVAGYFIINSSLVDRAEPDIYTWGLGAEFLAPLIFTAVYTLVTRGGWRENDMGVNLVLVELGLVPGAAVLFWTFAFSHGSLTNPVLGWVEIGSPWWTSIFLYWRNFLFIRARKEGTANGNTHPAVPGDAAGS